VDTCATPVALTVGGGLPVTVDNRWVADRGGYDDPRRGVGVDDYFDASTMAALRALRRDRKLTIAGGWRPAPHPDEETGEPLGDVIVWLDRDADRPLGSSSATPEERTAALVDGLIGAMLDPADDLPPRLPRRVVVEEPELAV